MAVLYLLLGGALSEAISTPTAADVPAAGR
jgi:hypothetical protein